MLAEVDYSNPMFWAVFLGWILSVVLHEFAHGVVAYFGGDYTIRERGGLTLNPLKYVDPVMTIMLPALFLLIGGIPLPGGATWVRRDLLRTREWQSAVSLAGPAMNLLIFAACVIPLHPHFGWVDYSLPPTGWNNFQVFLGATAVLQLIAVVLNLIPVPPLDGFGVLSPFMPPDLRQQVSTPPLSTAIFVLYFIIIWQTPYAMKAVGGVFDHLMQLLRFDGFEGDLVWNCVRVALYGHD